MGLESKFEYIDDLNSTWPLGTDQLKTVDDHVRGVKATLKNQFPVLGQASVPLSAPELTGIGKLRRAAAGIYDYAGNNTHRMLANSNWKKLSNSGFSSYSSDGSLITSSPGNGDITLESGFVPDRVRISAVLNLRMESFTDPLNLSVLDQTRAEIYSVTKGARVEGSVCVAVMPEYPETILLKIDCIDTVPAANRESYLLRLNHNIGYQLTYLVVSLHWFVDALGRRT